MWLCPWVWEQRSEEVLSFPALQSLAARLAAPSQRYSRANLGARVAGRSSDASGGPSAVASGPGTPGRPLGSSAGGGATERGSLAGGMPAEFLQDPSKYPIPHIPFLKCG